MALWVEKNHGDHGPAYIAEQIGRLALAGDEAGVTMWKKVAACYSELKQAPRRTARERPASLEDREAEVSG